MSDKACFTTPLFEGDFNIDDALTFTHLADAFIQSDLQLL